MIENPSGMKSIAKMNLAMQARRLRVFAPGGPVTFFHESPSNVTESGSPASKMLYSCIV